MKTGTTISFLVLLSALLLSSCATASKVANTRTVEVSEPRIEVSPMVVDLEVDSKRVSADTTIITDYKNAFFGLFRPRGTTSLSPEILFGKMLEEKNGDIIVLPKTGIDHIVEGKTMVTDHLYASGYVGRYKNFRPATKEDIDLINSYKNGTVGDDVPMTTIFLNDICNTSVASIGGESRKVEKRKYVRRTGFSVLLNLGVNFNSDWHINDIEQMNGSAVFGAQLSRHSFIGIGVGWEYFDIGGDNGSKKNYYCEIGTIPLFAQYRIYLLKTRFSPFFDFRAGWGFKQFCYTDDERADERAREYSGGGIFGADFGLAVGIFDLAFGFDYYTLAYQWAQPKMPVSPTLKIGFKF